MSGAHRARPFWAASMLPALANRRIMKLANYPTGPYDFINGYLPYAGFYTLAETFTSKKPPL
jgi:hypothetical protein